MKKRRETIEQLQAELDRHIHRCSKCGNYLLPDDDSPDIFCCPCCTIDNLQAQLNSLKAEKGIADMGFISEGTGERIDQLQSVIAG
ncbi:MAG TPA: hypothetical protein ENH82_13730, partial [bacterium]|nr:hypothetical protein [bacterium]